MLEPGRVKIRTSYLGDLVSDNCGWDRFSRAAVLKIQGSTEFWYKRLERTLAATSLRTARTLVRSPILQYPIKSRDERLCV